MRRDLVNGKQDSLQAVSSGIFHINTIVSTFQRLVHTLDIAKDTPKICEKLAPKELLKKSSHLQFFMVYWSLLVSTFPSWSWVTACWRKVIPEPQLIEVSLHLRNYVVAVLVAFLVSALFHELCIAVPCRIFKFLGFFWDYASGSSGNHD